jgi:hypothetical protein
MVHKSVYEPRRDETGIKIHVIAPDEGHTLIDILHDETVKERSFPKIFPTGEFGFDVQRAKKLSVRLL